MQLNKRYDTDKKRVRALKELQALQSTKGWQIVKDLIQENIDFLKEQIVGGKDEKGKFLSPEETDRMRNNLAIHQQIMDSPEFLIKKFSQEPVKEQEIEDPYD